MTENAPQPPQTQISNPEPSRHTSLLSSPAATLITLLLIILLGGYLRFLGINWDEYTHLHPDERFLTIVTSKLERPGSVLNYMRTSQSTLNPYNKGEGFYVYGNFPMTVTFYAGQAAEWARGFCEPGSETTFCRNPLTGYDGIHLVGRALSGGLDLVSVLFTFLIGKQIYGRRVGLLAAFLMATAVMAIQQSHFYTMDNWAATFSTITFYAAVRASEDSENYNWWAIFGLFLGLTVASRINVAPLALMAGVAGLVWLSQRYAAQRRARSPLAYLRTAIGRDDLQMIIIGGLLAAIISMLVFRVAMPYAFTDATGARAHYLAENGTEPNFVWLALQSTVGLNSQWLSNLEEIQRLQAPEASFPPALQWIDRADILFPLTNMLLYGMGPLAGLLAWIGFCVALWRIVRGRPDWVLHALPVAWVGLYFLFSATRWVKSIRYFLPIYPILFILAGWLLIHLWDKYKAQPNTQATSSLPSTLYPLLPLSLLILTPLTSLLWANAFVEIYRQPMTRIAATQWMFENIPTAATLIYETRSGEQKEMNLQISRLDLAAESPAFPIRFTLPEDGRIQAVRFNYLKDTDGVLEDGETLQIGLDSVYDQATIRGQAVLELGDLRQAHEIPLASQLLLAEEPHTIQVDLGTGGNVRFETSVITSEHWDDALPARYAGKDPYSQYFRGLSGGQMSTTHPDSDVKRDDLANWLDEADYIALSSQRSLWHLPRVPLTYPLMIRYYEALFSGELGFELEAEFHGDLQIGPLYISDTTGQVGWGERPNVGWPPPGDLAAEEAFSVYDHPPVWIFRKTENYSALRTREILGEVDLTQITVMNPLEATQAPNALMLTAEQQAQQQAGGTFREAFSPDGVLSNNGFAATFIWWLVVVVLGWVAFPLTFFVMRGLSDRGYALSRILAISLIAYFGWITASYNWLPFTGGTLWLGSVLLTIISGIILIRHWIEISDFILEKGQHILILEAIGLGLFLIFLYIRLRNPDAWHVIWGGEKPMDTAYFTAVLKSTTFPPYDPWHAGGYINYYYYGFVYAGTLTKMLRIVPTTAYNLILPMLFSFTGLAAFSLAYNLIINSQFIPAMRRYGYALTAGFTSLSLTVLLGNLAQVNVIFTAWLRASTLPETSSTLARITQGGWRVMSGQQPAPIYPGDWFWTATRAITINEGEVAPITEFPFFTFLYGDLHAHMIALPLSLLALGWAMSIVLQNRQISWGQMLIGALAIGVLYPTNSWDYPTYLVIGILALTYVNLKADRFSLITLGTLAVQAVTLFAISMLAYWPFWSDFGTAYTSLKLWEGSYTSVSNYLVIYGLFLLIILTYLFIDLKQWGQKELEWQEMSRQATWTTLGVLAALGLAPLMVWGLGRGYEILPLALALLLFAGLLAIRPQSSPQRRIVNTLISSAVALTLFVEIFVLDGDIGRMNTVFKFYMQVWVMLSIAAGAGFAWVWQRIRQDWSDISRTAWTTGLVALVFAAVLYPVLATRGKWIIREQAATAPITLDGMAFMAYSSYGDSGETVYLNQDYQAIQWMQRNIDGSPVIAEAHSGNPYRSIGNRVAMYTGLPSIIGWDWHQRQQRTTVPHNLVRQRITDVDTLYRTESAEQALVLLKKYDVSYVYVGQLEKLYYGNNGALKFDRMANNGLIQEVYDANGVKIYRVIN